MAGGQGVNNHHYAYWMPCPPLEAQKGPKSPGHPHGKVSSSLSLRLSIMAHHYRVQPFFSSTLQVQETTFITTQNSLQDCHQVQQNTVTESHQHINTIAS